MEDLTLKTHLPLIKRLCTYNLLVSENLENKIRYLCSKIWDREWSGILFYTSQGTFEDNTLCIKAIDVLVLDIGTIGFTTFNMSPDTIAYMTEHPELLEEGIQTGLIHSHHSMQTFFSGTDTATLQTEGEERNHFVSLIVNNQGIYSAAITRRTKVKQKIEEVFSYNTFENHSINGTALREKEEEVFEWFSLNISLRSTIQEELDQQINKIREVQNAAPKFSNSTPGSLFASKQVNNAPIIPLKSNLTSTPYSSYPSKNLGKNTNAKKDKQFSPHLGYENCKDYDDYDSYRSPSIPRFSESGFVDKTKIHSMFLKLITGSIILPDETKINASRWVSGMVSLFEKSFGKGEKGFKKFQEWAEGYVDFLLWSLLAEEFDEEVFSEEEGLDMIAMDLIAMLRTVTQNKYITEYINIVIKYRLLEENS
jgi:hypothetical protein